MAMLKHQILTDMNGKQKLSFWDTLQGFYHAIDWTEPWIIGLLAFHVVVLVVRCGVQCCRHRAAVVRLGFFK